jgi:Delta3-Delta2-enoyl-CoA isomerase
VNAINVHVIRELRTHFERLEHDAGVSSIVLTGAGKFFSFGFDIPEFFPLSKAEFTQVVAGFSDLYRYIFLYSKPVVAALNGHAIAGGCMLALACDRRIMATGRAKIGLNEIAFGSSVFAGSTEMLRFWTGSANASRILLSGTMFPAEEAKILGLVDELIAPDDVSIAARKAALALAEASTPAFASIKSLLRRSVAEETQRREGESIKEFVEIWYSDAVRANLAAIKIHEAK